MMRMRLIEKPRCEANGSFFTSSEQAEMWRWMGNASRNRNRFVQKWGTRLLDSVERQFHSQQQWLLGFNLSCVFKVWRQFLPSPKTGNGTAQIQWIILVDFTWFLSMVAGYFVRPKRDPAKVMSCIYDLGTMIFLPAFYSDSCILRSILQSI
jgi:hypothetical protein